MMTESERGDCWPGFLICKDCNIMIRLCFRREMEKRYTHKVQKLCKSSEVDKSRPGNLNQEPFKSIINQAKEIAPLITSIILSLRSNSNICLTSHLASIKLLAVLIFMCRSAHRNNSNYIPLLVAMYLYLARAKVDAITLLNHLGLSVLYNSLLQKLRDIKAPNAAFIKQQATNYKLVGSWNNFEYRKNVMGEKIGDTVKFQSVIMAFWIKNGWKMPTTSLKQWIWNAKRDMINFYELTKNVFGSESVQIRDQYIKFYQF